MVHFVYINNHIFISLKQILSSSFIRNEFQPPFGKYAEVCKLNAHLIIKENIKRLHESQKRPQRCVYVPFGKLWPTFI